MNYPNNHKHKFFQKDHEKMMCSECEFELDGEYYVGYVLPLEEKIASMEKELKDAKSINDQLMLAVSQPELVLTARIAELTDALEEIATEYVYKGNQTKPTVGSEIARRVLSKSRPEGGKHE